MSKQFFVDEGWEKGIKREQKKVSLIVAKHSNFLLIKLKEKSMNDYDQKL